MEMNIMEEDGKSKLFEGLWFNVGYYQNPETQGVVIHFEAGTKSFYLTAQKEEWHRLKEKVEAAFADYEAELVDGCYTWTMRLENVSME